MRSRAVHSTTTSRLPRFTISAVHATVDFIAALETYCTLSDDATPHSGADSAIAAVPKMSTSVAMQPPCSAPIGFVTCLPTVSSHFCVWLCAWLAASAVSTPSQVASKPCSGRCAPPTCFAK